MGTNESIYENAWVVPISPSRKNNASVLQPEFRSPIRSMVSSTVNVHRGRRSAASHRWSPKLCLVDALLDDLLDDSTIHRWSPRVCRTLWDGDLPQRDLLQWQSSSATTKTTYSSKSPLTTTAISRNILLKHPLSNENVFTS